MTWIDILIILTLAMMMLKGFVKGLVREACELVGIVFAIVYAYRAYHYWGDELIYRFGLPELIAYPLAFGCIVLVISLVAGLCGLLLGKALHYTPMSMLDHLGGIGLGLAKGFVLICLVLVMLSSMPFEGIDMTLNQSPLAQQFLGIAPRLYSGIDAVLPPEFHRWHQNDMPIEEGPQVLQIWSPVAVA